MTKRKFVKPKGGKGKFGNKGKPKSTNSKELYTIENVTFDIGNAKHAASIDTHLRIVVSHIQQDGSTYGEHRQDVAEALETGVYTKPEGPDPTSLTNPVNKEEEPDKWEMTKETLLVKFKEEYRRWQDKVLAYEVNQRSAAALLWSKCTQKLQHRIRDAEDHEALQKDMLEMKAAIRKYATSFQPNAHPLMQVVDAIRTLFNIKQADDWGGDEFEKKINSARKVFEERLGCKLIPVKYMQSLEGYADDKKDEYEKKAWTELIAFVGTIGLNDTKYKSLKEDLKYDYAKGNNTYPKTLKEVKLRIENRTWDSVPQTTRKESNQPSKTQKAANIAAGARPQASFYQKTHEERRCYCCGAKNHILPNCKKKADTPKEQWFQETGVVLQQLAVILSNVQASASSDASTVTQPTVQSTPAGSGAQSQTGPTTATNVCQYVLPNQEETCLYNVGNRYDSVPAPENACMFSGSQHLRHALLLDNQSTAHIFCNSDFVRKTWNAPHSLKVQTNGGILDVSQQGSTYNFGEVWYNPQAITNVLSFSEVRDQVGPENMGYDPWKDLFWVNANQHHYEFKRVKEGLYYCYPRARMASDDFISGRAAVSNVQRAVSFFQHSQFLDIQEETKKLYTQRQINQAQRARKLLHAAGHPNPDDLAKMVQTNQIKNCPVTKADFKVARHVYGHDISTLKGKNTRRKPIPVVQEVVDIPKELSAHRDVTLALDIVKVNNIPFLTTISLNLQYRTCQRIIPKKTKEASFYNAIDRVLRLYNKGGYRVTEIRCDTEFKTLLAPLEDENSVTLNLAAAEEHVPEIERSNRVIKERVRACYHRLPYKQMPMAMLVAMVEDCAYKTNFFPLKSGISSYYSPRTLVEKKMLDYKLHLKHSFGEFVMAPLTTTNTPSPRMAECIYLQPAYNAQGGHVVYNLQTKKVITRHTVTSVPISRAIINLVNALGAEQGVTNILFQTKHKRLIWDSSLIAGVDYTENENDEDDDEDDDDYSEEEDESDDDLFYDDDEESVEGLPIDEEEARSNQAEGPPDEEHSQPDELLADDEDQTLITGVAEEVYDEDILHAGMEQAAADLNDLLRPSEEEVIFEEEEPELRRSERDPQPRVPYNADSFVQDGVIEGEVIFDETKCDPLVGTEKGKSFFQYQESQAPKLAVLIHKCFLQTYNLREGLKEFGERPGQEGYEAAYKEVAQLHGRKGLQPVRRDDLTELEAKRALEAVTVMLRKRSGKVKSRTCADGRKQKLWLSKEEVASPTVATEAVILTSLVDAQERRHVVTADVPNAFIQADIQTQPGDPRTVLVLRGVLVDMLLRIDQQLYERFVETKPGGRKVLYLIVNKALYGMIDSPMMWNQKLTKWIKSQGFEINPYDPCVANKEVNGSNITLTWHVDDLKISHKDKKVVDAFIKALEDEYNDENGKVTVEEGPRQAYVGMILDFSEEGTLKIDQSYYIKEMIQEFEQLQKIGTAAAVPWNDHLFQVDEKSPRLKVERAEQFHTFVAKALYAAFRGRPDLKPIVAFLSTRVQKPTEQDWNKLVRMMKFLKGTPEDVLTLRADGSGILNWYWDASFAVHPDYKSHTGGSLTMGSGSIISASKKQKLNTRSSTEAELVAVDDGMGFVLWVRLFLEAQGLTINHNIVHQDNKSAILLEKNGKASSSQRTRHINIRYFFATDQIEKGNLTIQFCPTDEMIADYFTKPLSGTKFHLLRALVMGHAMSNITLFQFLSYLEAKEQCAPCVRNY